MDSIWRQVVRPFATFPGVLAGLLVLIYFYYRQRNVRGEDAFTTESNAICESNGTVVKRLFSLAIPVSMANIMLPYGITH